MYHGHHSPEQHHAPLTARSSPSSAPYSRAPAPIEVSEARPSGPALLPPTRSTEAPAYQQHSHHHASAAAPPPPMATAEYSPRYTAPPPPPPSYDYSYRQPSHHAYDRTPFTGTTTAVSTPAGYTRGGSVSAGSSVSYATAPGAEYARYPDLGHLGMGGDSKQRKRRGNLPKETTDKLRSWFMAHLSHPYPTEDEKQDLMRQTGLQMSESTAIQYTHTKLKTATNIFTPRPNLQLVHQRPPAPAADHDLQRQDRVGCH